MVTFTEALEMSLNAAPIADTDQAAVRLLRRYAEQLDAGADVSRIGPLYLVALESLGLTVRARAAITGKKAESGGSGPNPLDELRERRERRARENRTPDLDPAS